jgi:hypothetical protein
VAGFCDCGAETSELLKAVEFIENLSDYWHLKGIAPRNLSINYFQSGFIFVRHYLVA